MVKKLTKLKNYILFLGSLVAGLLGAWGGAENTSKSWRRILIPILLSIIGIIFTQSWIPIIILLWIFVFSAGYGVPDETDEGSDIGAFWYKITKGNSRLTDILTRGTIGLLFAIVLSIISLFKGNWGILIITGSLCVLGSVGSLLFRKLATFKLFGKQLTWDEFGVNSILGLAGLLHLL